MTSAVVELLEPERARPRLVEVPVPQVRVGTDPRIAPSEHLRPPLLESLRIRLGGTVAAVVRFETEAERFVIADFAGLPFLARGATFPLPASTFLREAESGRQSFGPITDRQAVLDRVMAALGMSSASAYPLVIDRQTPGALLVAWRENDSPAGPIPDLTARHLYALEQILLPRPRPRTCLVCHEDQMVAGGLARELERHLGIDTVLACSPDAALAALSSRAPDLIVCSDHLSAECPSVIAQKLRQGGAGAPLLILARTEGPRSLDRALAAGAAGYVPLTGPPEALLDAALGLLDGRAILPRTIEPSADAPTLTAREHDVLLRLDRGLSDKQIASELSVALSTVKTHARSIYFKLDASSRSAAVHKARNIGLI